MSSRTFQLDARIHDYLVETTLREPPLLRALREETAGLPQAEMQISPEQGQLMMMLTRLIGARRALEVGVFTGYSSLCVALALPAEGQLVACDVSDEWTSIARRYWRQAGVDHKITLHLAPALDTLDALLVAGETDGFDLAFIDADKRRYDAYYERALQLVRPGGVILIDNMLWNGRVADPAAADDDTLAIRALNAKIRRDPRVEAVLVPVGDGLQLIRKSG